MHRTLIISNGFGEDQIGTKLAKAMTEQCESSVNAISLVGPGKAYQDISIPIITQVPIMPSGGFIRTPQDLWYDLKAGLLKTYRNAYRTIKSEIAKHDIIIAVGDVFCLFMASGHKHTHRYFLPTAKSNRFMPHSKWELRYIQKKSRAVYPRDIETTLAFQEKGIKAHYLGNPMFDLDIKDSLCPVFSSTEPIVGLLPGSRNELYPNLESMLTIIEHPAHTYHNHAIALAHSASREAIEAILYAHQWQPSASKRWVWRPNPKKEIIINATFDSILQHSHFIIGLSGTANEQAAYFGKPTFSFPGHGPQSTPKRFKEQSLLMKENITFINTQIPEKIIQTIQTQLSHQTLKPKQVPSPRAARAIISNILT